MKLTSTSRLAVLALVLVALAPLSAKENDTAADRPLTIVNMVPPTYPYLMRRAEAQAQVTVLFKVDAKGLVTDAKIIDSNNPEFVAPALDAVRQWKFAPAIKNGQPVESRATQTFVFSFRNQPATEINKGAYAANEKR
jgi:TonB family protein